MTSLERPGRRRIFDFGVWAAVALVFGPSLMGLARLTVSSQQLRDAGLVLVFALLYLLRGDILDNRPSLSFSRRTVGFLAGACLVAVASSVFRLPVLMVVALGLLAGGVLLYVMGDRFASAATGLATAFGAFILLALTFPLFDVPLRLFAANSALRFLQFVGATPGLGLLENPPRLILELNGRLFEVAPECNGFGIMSSCVLVALLLVFSRRLSWVDKALVLLLAPLVGLFSNTLRILLIVTLAPVFGEKAYGFLHEAVGIGLFLGTLCFLWWMANGLPERRSGRQIKSAIS